LPKIKRRKNVKLTRKEMKEDKLVTFTAKAIKWLRERFQLILMGVGAVAAIAVVVGGFFIYRSYTYGRASGLLDEAVSYYRVKEDVAEKEDKTAREARYTKAVEALRKVVEGYPRTPSAREALFYLGESYFQLGKYKEAIEAYDRLSRGYPQDMIAPLALNSLAYAYEQVKDHKKAIETYNRLIEKYPNHALGKRAYLNMGRLKEAEGNYEEAKKNYQKVIDLYPNTLIASQAQNNLDWIAATAKVKVESNKPEGQK
jgi:tetratricopeptide (TPR) repeat protein